MSDLCLCACVCVCQLLAVSGPFQSWSPVRQSDSQSFHRVDLLQGTSEHDGLIDRARRIKVRGHADSLLPVSVFILCERKLFITVATNNYFPYQ